ncbi:MFS transporter [Devosia sp. FJ2-5-3]|jgi:MFS family permease|uniref:MFS transporter n=1 Tax=Devosia sp. FJ2-5-3 TaxID=2976680 RepID=UPI0023D89C32|nr:MFS transporter [Devosia sp. FJ2-5-3]WEJ60307.1 MFS transporter [Devosia sp. FJ2-5-3]
MSGVRPLAALAAATVASVGGTRLSVIAIPWLVLTTTGSPVLTGLVGMAELLPYVVAKALAGPLIDRLGARRMAITCDLLSMVAVGLVPLLHFAGLLQFYVLLPAVALIGVLRAPADAAKQALVPYVADIGNMPLERVTGIMGASDRLAGTLGAAAAGGLIALIGPMPALMVNAGAFLASAILVSAGVPKQVRAVAAGQPVSYRADFSAGWAALRNEPVLMAMVVMIAVTNLFDQAYAIVLLPVWVREAGLDVSWVGILLAIFSAGAIAGATVAAATAEKLPRLFVYTTGFVFAGPAPMVALASGLPMPVLAGVLTISGFAAGFLNPIVGAILFERIPKAMVGRVIALVGALGWVLMPFGGLYAGVLVTNTGISPALVLTGMLYLVAALSPIAVPAFRQMKRQQPAKA